MNSTIEIAEHETEAVVACPECGGELIHIDYETFCDVCGLVEEVNALHRGPTFDNRGRRKHSSGANTRLRHDGGIGNTAIAYVPGLESPQVRRMRRLQNHAQYGTKQERGQIYVNSEIGRIGAALGQSNSIREQACALYDEAMEKSLAVGRSLDGFAGACVLTILRVHGLPFTLEDVADVTRCSTQKVGSPTNRSTENSTSLRPRHGRRRTSHGMPHNWTSTRKPKPWPLSSPRWSRGTTRRPAP